MYKAKIRDLEAAHRNINKQIDDMERNHPHVDVTTLSEMKKKKLQYKDEIARLNRLQWEYDHEQIHGDE
ncbi:COG5570 Uncharacterized small protein [uncultured Caudovirales phage]|uniref:COG5570 Uncharacterized small protein n=1 Tax=uncultured Caudovirales phage TaxID=2100421 RepID=A0A6J5LJY2_9CAUD|nr:COG5570 Uncharacterized small protein [uncultured Caudovirales phage]